MEYQEHKHFDWSEYEPGVWNDEPDKIQWRDEATGLPCLIVRGPIAVLCGYVGVSKGHRLYGKFYEELSEEDCVEIHNGLNFGSKCQVGEDTHALVCHTVEDGEDDDVWWLGFDCGHSGDITPDRKGGRKYDFSIHGYTYKDVDYVKNEVKDLARQLKNLMGAQQ